MEKADEKFLDQLERDYLLMMNQILAVNQDLPERIRRLGMRTIYDLDDDTVIVRIGEEQEALSPSIQNELFLRVDPGSLKIVGAELTHFSEHQTKRSAILGFFRDLWQIAGMTSWTVVSQADDEIRVDLVQDMRELVSA
ncbi:MAG: hypothetical protein ACR2PL_22075 [Dehalococcoidia bacterium]